MTKPFEKPPTKGPKFTSIPSPGCALLTVVTVLCSVLSLSYRYHRCCHLHWFWINIRARKSFTGLSFTRRDGSNKQDSTSNFFMDSKLSCRFRHYKMPFRCQKIASPRHPAPWTHFPPWHLRGSSRAVVDALIVSLFCRGARAGAEGTPDPPLTLLFRAPPPR